MSGKSIRRFLLIFFSVLILIGGVVAFIGYRLIFSPNVNLPSNHEGVIYIPTGSDFEYVKNVLFKENLLKNEQSFLRVAEIKKYPLSVKPGRYRISENMSNNELINHLRSGNQEPVALLINNIRTKEELSVLVAKHLEADSNEILQLLNDDAYLVEFDFNSHDVLALIIPNTYYLNWTTNARQFIARMHHEFNSFWNENRKNKAAQMGFSPAEITVIASIVEHETWRNEDKPKIAGVYINRLRIGMPLQADPTLIWALGDFSIRRVLNIHKEIDSPYNTYKYAGLPPGPIGIASISSIDAVLNYEKHDYLYFVAREDFSGYSNFSRTYQEHLQNARRYQQELDRRNIRR